MRQPEDEALLRDMLAHARKAIEAVGGRERGDLDSDFILAAALERFVEVVGEAAAKEATPPAGADLTPWCVQPVTSICPIRPSRKPATAPSAGVRRFSSCTAGAMSWKIR